MEGKTPLIEVRNLTKHFPVNLGIITDKPKTIKAVDGVSFKIHKGETFGLVGESGCGKSTTGNLILRLLPATSGEVLLNGVNIQNYREKEFRKLRKDLQIIFQNSSCALDPKMTIEDILSEPLLIHKIVPRMEISKEVNRLLQLVGLSSLAAKKFPHEFSGGQKQRIGIAKALSTRPKFILCDEPVSSLDVSIQSQILNLMGDLQKEYSLTYLFIAHGLNVVRHVSSRVGVMYLGKIVEIGDVEQIYNNPRHPYTQALISAFLEPDLEYKRDRVILKGEIPSPINRPKGCAFHPRCHKAMDICKEKEPLLAEIEEGYSVSCFLNECN
ncbi:peptide/nickel transport system ATP-binding protein [Proteiniborus ethanoligenes]|uniref:Peptide/nickel transport system ATP-binding protein n=1 Tax=Proteiniborus ethanoligenes TaxID=415015 RepID=A0A1H3P8S1_9FIRM|nr:ABC transporter ATP-binding protein [Proteiniborus ethanoligenes]SDY97440.1 peptide/nickel transport system ATP-binding protein [Proteiniborus ethanoligenes]